MSSEKYGNMANQQDKCRVGTAPATTWATSPRGGAKGNKTYAETYAETVHEHKGNRNKERQQTTSITDASMSKRSRATDDEGELEATSGDHVHHGRLFTLEYGPLQPGGVPPQAVSTETVRPSWVNYQTTLRERKHY